MFSSLQSPCAKPVSSYAFDWRSRFCFRNEWAFAQALLSAVVETHRAKAGLGSCLSREALNLTFRNEIDTFIQTPLLMKYIQALRLFSMHSSSLTTQVDLSTIYISVGLLCRIEHTDHKAMAMRLRILSVGTGQWCANRNGAIFGAASCHVLFLFYLFFLPSPSSGIQPLVIIRMDLLAICSLPHLLFWIPQFSI